MASRARSGDAGVPQPVRHSRSEQQSDSLSAGQRQHLRAACPTARSTAPAPIRPRSAARCRRPTTKKFSATTTASWSAAASITAGSISRSSSQLGFINPDLSVVDQSGDSGQRRDHPHARRISATARSGSTPPTPITASLPPTRSTSPANSRSTAGARLNVAKIKMADQLGTSPELNSSPTYSRINPVVGSDLQDRARAHGLWRLFGIEPRADAARARLLQSATGPA